MSGAVLSRWLETLEDLGVHVLEPETNKDESFADTLHKFATFCLEERPETTQTIINKYMGDTVGELQGGSDQHSIYRFSIDETVDGASVRGKGNLALEELMATFTNFHPRATLSIDRLKQYMLDMCNDERRQDDTSYDRLGNLMFILSMGPVPGQVRHIDHMDPNLQICLYMSEGCPATVIYVTESPPITNCEQLLDHWQSTAESLVPEFLRETLLGLAEVPLSTIPALEYFSFWKTLDGHLANFGKLYQPIEEVIALQGCRPGTTLLAGGNQVHAGPPSSVPRMFAFAIGIPADSSSLTENTTMEGSDIEAQNGEIQYNPVLMHLDLCCILFATLDSKGYDVDQKNDAKMFLLKMTVPFIEDFPKVNYDPLISDDRVEMRTWLSNLVEAVNEKNDAGVGRLLQTAVSSKTILQCPATRGSQTKRKKDKKAKKTKHNKPNGRMTTQLTSYSTGRHI